MSLKNIQFKNREGSILDGQLEFPVDQSPHSYAILVHSFGQNTDALRNISGAMAGRGFGVLRLEFTGRGSDLPDAASFLRETYSAPSLLVGHSLGGVAALLAAAELQSVRAIATIATPSDASQLKLSSNKSGSQSGQENLETVELGDRHFCLESPFLDDLRQSKLKIVVPKLSIPLLFLHSPQDSVVAIQNAARLYGFARHPKSFISLDRADHLLTNSEDSLYTGDVIASWALRYISRPKNNKVETDLQVVASLSAEAGFTTELKAGRHYFRADEPETAGGNDFGPSPYDLLSAGLAACTAMTLQLYAKRKGWPLEEVRVHVGHGKTHAEDCKDCDSSTARIDTFRRQLELVGELDTKQQERLLEIANKCPVHRTLQNKSQVLTELVRQ